VDIVRDAVEPAILRGNIGIEDIAIVDAHLAE